MSIFHQLLANTFLVSMKNNFVWFALTYWVYLSTKSVISTSLVGGTFLVAAAVSSVWLGSLVDKHRKKQVMLWSNIVTLIFFVLGFLLYILQPQEVFASVLNPQLWLMIVLLMAGVIAGAIYGIAVPTMVTLLVPKEGRDKANGLLGTVMGLSFAATSVGSGLILGYGGMTWVLGIAIALTLVDMLHLLLIPIEEKKIIHLEEAPEGIDFKGTFKVVRSIPGLFALILFTTFNNFIGGVFMALMDAYGLSLVTVQIWGLLWGVLSFGFIFGGLFIAKFGLGKNPLRTLFMVNSVIWVTCIFFPIQPSIVLLSLGGLVWMSLVPFIEATEQTIIQAVVPPQRQGRVFGFAQSVEQAASPLTAFLIGPIAQFLFIPFMTTGRGVELIGSWFGTGTGRGIALVFMMAGVLGLIVTMISMRSNVYRLLADRYSS